MKQDTYLNTDRILKMQLDDANQLFVRCNLEKVTKKQMQYMTAKIIYDLVQSALSFLLPNNQIDIYKVEMKSIDQANFSNKLKQENNYNNYSSVSFLQNLFKSNQDQSYFSNIDQENELNQNISKSIITVEEIVDNLIKQLTQILIYPSEKAIKEFKNISVYQQGHNKQEYNIIMITFCLNMSLFTTLNEYQIKLIQNLEPIVLNFKNAEILNKDQFTKYIKLQDINFFYITPEDLYEMNLDIPQDRQIFLYLTPYFQYKNLNQLCAETYLTFDDTQPENSTKKIIILINIDFKIKLKVEFQLSNCQYCHQINDDKKCQLYFKLNNPPFFSVALFSKSTIELLDTQLPWYRVENIYLNSYFQKHQNLLEKFIIVNNTVIQIQFHNISLQHKLINNILLRLQQMQLLHNNKVELHFIQSSIRNSKFDILISKLNQSSLNFNQKYNIFCLVSQNRIIDCKHLNKIIVQFEEFYKKNNNTLINDQILNNTFKLFMRFSDNLKTSIRMSDINNRNLKIFRRDFSSSQELIIQKIQQNNLILVKNLKLTPSGYIPLLSCCEKDKLIIRLFKENNFIKVKLTDEDGQFIIKNEPISNQYCKIKLIEGIELFNQKFKLLGQNYIDLRYHIFWMCKVDLELYRSLSIKQQQDFTFLEKLNVVQLKFENLFLDGFSIKFEQLIIESYEQQKLNINYYGYISRNLIQKIRDQLKNNEISAVQIVVNGIQYILQLNNQLKNDIIKLDSSMMQFKLKKNIIQIVDYNKQRGAYLNNQIIRILIQIGIKEDVFEQLLKWHLEQIQTKKMMGCSSLDLKSDLLGQIPIYDAVNMMKNKQLNEQNCLFIKKVNEKLQKLEIQMIRSKFNILVERAERLFGIVDDQGILNEGEVICVRKAVDQLSYLHGELIVIGDCIFDKNTIFKVYGLSIEDIKSRNGRKDQYDEYINCIIFSNKQNLNSELCLNTYFVSWDQRLIPQTLSIQNKIRTKIFKQFDQEDMSKNLLDLMNNQIQKEVVCNHLIIDEKDDTLESMENILRKFDGQLVNRNCQINDLDQINEDNRISYRFYWMEDKKNYEKYVKECLGQENIKKALKCLNHIFDSFNSWMKLYDISDEYEIYSGYYENKKDDKNLRSFQDQMMFNLECLRIEINEILSKNQKDKLIQIWLLHFIVIIQDKELQIENLELEKIVKSVKQEIQSHQKSSYLLSRLKNKYNQWFKGCSWYFFVREILAFEI